MILTEHKTQNIINILSILLFISSSLLIIGLILIHPLVGDDYFHEIAITSGIKFKDYFLNYYYYQSGRIFTIILGFLVYQSDYTQILFKVSVFPSFLFICYIIYFKILNHNSLNKNIYAFLTFIIITWFIIPQPSETIVWIAGSIVYLFPLILGIIYLNILNSPKNLFENKILFFIYIVVSFFLGTAHIQLAAGCFVISSFFLVDQLKYLKNKKKLLISNIILYLFFLLGFILFLISPGNLNRLGAIEDLSFFSQIYKSIIYLLSIFFYLGDIKSFLIFFLFLITFYFFFSSNIEIKSIFNKNIYPWFLGSLFSVIIVIPMINFVSIRNIFFPMFFLFIFLMKILLENNILKKTSNSPTKLVAILILNFCLFVDSSVSFATNYYYKIENSERMNIINKTINENGSTLKLPNYTLIPSRLTHLQTPAHDHEFLIDFGKSKKIDIYLDDSNPMSTNIYKIIKNLFSKQKFIKFKRFY